ncbi:hypothetical protein D3C80_565850 [compost metagenome]
MSSGCGDVLSLEDLKTAKKHQTFEAEVITGRAGGVASGTNIDFATNMATGQVQKTMPAILRDIGFRPASFDFVTGGTIGVNDRDLAVLWPLPGGDGDWYYWEGALPKVIPASSTPLTTGGITDGAWRPIGDLALRAQLITPEMYGAVGDGIADDTNAWLSLLGFVEVSSSSSRHISIFATRKYRLTAPLSGQSHSTIYGGGTLYYDGADTLNSTILTYQSRVGFSIDGIKITRSYIGSPLTLWSKQANALKCFDSSDFALKGIDAYQHTDAIGCTNCERFEIKSCKTHQLGEEGIAVRQSRNWIVSDCDVYDHAGDGILMKTANASTHDGQIINCRVRDGIGPNGAGNYGGGITLNDEGTGSSTSMIRMVVSQCQAFNVSYGIAFTNIVDLSITGCQVYDVDRFGIIIDTAIFNNPQLNPIKRVVVSGNSVRQSVQAGIQFFSANGIAVESVIISGNIVDTCGTSVSTNYPSISAEYATISGNIILNSRVAIQANHCVIVGNKISGSTFSASESASAWIILSNEGVFSGNRVEDANFGHIRFTSLQGYSFSGNSIKTASTFACLYFDTVTDASTVKFGANNYDSQYPAVSRFVIGGSVISQLQLTPAESGRKSRAFDGTIPNVAAFVGDEIIKVAAGAGEARRYICTTAGTPGVYTPVEWVTIAVSSSSSDQTIANNATLRISANSPGMLSTSACVGAKFNQNPQGVDMTASVTEAGTVTFVLTNRTGNSKTFTGLVLTAYCHL